MNGLIQRPNETDLEWQLRLSNIIAAQERLIVTQRAEINLLLADRTFFDLSADSTPAYFKRQIGPTS